LNVPAVVGVPVISPVIKLRGLQPVGSEPLFIVKVYGAIPPVTLAKQAERVAEYAVSFNPSGRAEQVGHARVAGFGILIDTILEAVNFGVLLSLAVTVILWLPGKLGVPEMQRVSFPDPETVIISPATG
jgi:hypothetical protein